MNQVNKTECFRINICLFICTETFFNVRHSVIDYLLIFDVDLSLYTFSVWNPIVYQIWTKQIFLSDSIVEKSRTIVQGHQYTWFCFGFIFKLYYCIFFFQMINGDIEEVTETAASICRGYLNGAWKKITSGDITVKKLCGGLSNWLFIVSLQKEAVSPKHVLVRLYGQTHCEDALESVITESVIFTLLSERKLGPKLYGVFPGGRIEEYIQARPLKQHEMSDPDISLLVAEKMAAVHVMNIPINKEPRWMWDTINKWLDSLSEVAQNERIGGIYSLQQLRSEAEWLRNHLSKIYSPVVFCHNDLQQGNILLREDTPDPSIVFIDYEYCSYNYRGFDLANHFMEWCYDYNLPECPHFSVNKRNYPSHAQMLTFVERYLSSVREHGGKCKADHDRVHSILKEVKHYSLATHILWGLWAAINSHFSQIPFGYKEFAEHRLDCYYMLKNEILSKHGFSPDKIIPVKRKILEAEE